MRHEGDEGLMDEGLMNMRFEPTWIRGDIWDLRNKSYKEQVDFITDTVQNRFASEIGEPCLNTWRTDNAAAKSDSTLNENKKSYVEFRCTSHGQRKPNMDLSGGCPVVVKLTRTNNVSKCQWTLTDIEENHCEGCKKPSRRRSMKTDVFMTRSEMRGLSRPSAEQVTDALQGFLQADLRGQNSVGSGCYVSARLVQSTEKK